MPPPRQADIQPPPVAVEARPPRVSTVDPLPPNANSPPEIAAPQPEPPAHQVKGVFSALKRMPDLLRPEPPPLAGEAPRPPLPVGTASPEEGDGRLWRLTAPHCPSRGFDESFGQVLAAVWRDSIAAGRSARGNCHSPLPYTR
jgi:hypothetical protein